MVIFSLERCQKVLRRSTIIIVYRIKIRRTMRNIKVKMNPIWFRRNILFKMDVCGHDTFDERLEHFEPNKTLKTTFYPLSIIYSKYLFCKIRKYDTRPKIFIILPFNLSLNHSQEYFPYQQNLTFSPLSRTANTIIPQLLYKILTSTIYRKVCLIPITTINNFSS